MIILGISSGFHDAAVTVVKSGKILFADTVKDTVNKKTMRSLTMN